MGLRAKDHNEQSSSLEFRLVFFVVRSCVKQAISKLLVDQFIRKFEQLTSYLKFIKFFAESVHQGLRYCSSGGTIEAKKDQPKFHRRALDMDQICGLRIRHVTESHKAAMQWKNITPQPEGH